MRPIAEGLISYEAVFADPPILDIVDIQRMNDLLDVRQENEYRARNAYETKIKAARG